MLKNSLYALFLGFFITNPVLCASVNCIHYLHAGSEKICLKDHRETRPAFVTEIDNKRYYAAATLDNLSKLKIKYNGYTYSICNLDDTEYELIHWLSGDDELIDNVWIDRLATTTSDTGPLNYVNKGCQHSSDGHGYYSSNGDIQYFYTTTVPTLYFGPDWYAEVTFVINDTYTSPSTNGAYLVDFGSVTSINPPYCGEGFGLRSPEYPNYPNTFISNTKPFGQTNKSISSTTDLPLYTLGTTITVRFGTKAFTQNTSRAFIQLGNDIQYGAEYEKSNWANWHFPFYLFRGVIGGYAVKDATIYDLKIYRKKSN